MKKILRILIGCFCRNGVFTGDIRKTNAALDFLKRTITDDYKRQRTLILKF